MTQVADKDRNSLARVKALTFDTGGTVLDWHSGIRSALSAAGERHGLVRDWAAITNTYRRRSLQRMTGQVRPAFNIDDVHRSVLDELIDEYELGGSPRLIAPPLHDSGIRSMLGRIFLQRFSACAAAMSRSHSRSSAFR